MKYLLFLFLFPALHAQSGFNSQQSGMTGTIRGLDVVAEKVVWVSGTKGEFSVTRNGGISWFHDTVPGAGKLDFRDVQGFSAKEALLMSAGPGTGSAIYRTVNGGKKWDLMYQNTDPKAFFDGMDFFDKNHGLIIGDPVDEKPYLLETKDGGRTWLRLKPDRVPDLVSGEYAFAASGTSLDANPDGSCYLVTGGSVARAFRSADFGKTWEVAPLPFMQGDPAAGAFSVAAGLKKQLAAAGGNYQKMTISGVNIALSSDNGLSWNVPEGASQVPFMECVRWINAETLVACGPPGVWISQDSGKSWSEVSKDGFHTMEVVPNRGAVWMAGNKGKVVKWR
jgi:photosystem II stability/assembly factor-like uncharacterized protein